MRVSAVFPHFWHTYKGPRLDVAQVGEACGAMQVQMTGERVGALEISVTVQFLTRKSQVSHLQKNPSYVQKNAETAKKECASVAMQHPIMHRPARLPSERTLKASKREEGQSFLLAEMILACTAAFGSLPSIKPT